MAERLIQIVIPAERADRLRELLRQADTVESWHDTSESVRLFTVQAAAEKVEGVLDPIEAVFGSADGFHAVVLPVEATLPRPQEPEQDLAETGPTAEPAARPTLRVSREELYADLSEHTRVTRVFLAMVILSTVVAAVGISRNNAAVVIGAMVMAPLLGPNMALALATTLGDAKLAAQAFRAICIGLGSAMAVALVCGLLLSIDLNSTEIVSRTFVSPIDLVVALAAGIAGALAFTAGVPASLVGVMVAVALLPPLVVCLMLLAKGNVTQSLGALLLLLCNVISVNLAGVGTFLLQGVSPRTWWDAARSKRMSRRALGLWIVLLVVVAVLIFLSNLSQGR
jgi:uncharacterized hydrophobic protein (TIGR00341 family)